MKKYISILLTSITLTLAACGGGGSDSSTSGTRFTGAQTITVLGSSSQAAFVMTVSGSSVTINDEDFTASGALQGNDFSVAVPPFTQTLDGITCTFNITYTGILEAPTRATGTLNGSSVSCLGSSFAITGNFAANAGNAKQLLKTLSQAITELVVN